MVTDRERWIVWFRDGFCCAYCGYEGTLLKTHNLTVAHRIPVARGGSDAVPNLQTACLTCGAAKGDRTDAEFRRTLARAKPIPIC